MLVSDCFRQNLKSLYLNEYPCETKSIRVIFIEKNLNLFLYSHMYILIDG